MKDVKTDNEKYKVILKNSRVGLGGCELNKKQVFEHAWEKGVRTFDDGW